ncbi:calcium-binding protein [Fulvimarina sp. MAC8]|uniref:calcium-binding protein n=1 Tax=Fulvimarina sp. MAC8 TaxID=3162874 RepID=UPI0032ECC521
MPGAASGGNATHDNMIFFNLFKIEFCTKGVHSLSVENAGEIPMGQFTGTSGDDVFYLEGQPLQGGTAHSYYALEGDDTVYGSSIPDYIHGGDGNDILFGEGDDDFIQGQAGNDQLYGGSGDDNLGGGTGSDTLVGGTGNDLLRGNQGNDNYRYQPGQGMDTISEDQGPAGLGGEGGGTDLLFFNALAADIRIYGNSSDLLVTTVQDIADGFIDEGVLIEDFHLGGDHVVEILQSAEGYQFDLTVFV